MISEILWSLNPINWDISSMTETFQSELILLLLLVFLVMLIDLADIKINFITPNLCASIVVSGFLIIRYIGSGFFSFLIPILYILFILVREKAEHFEKKMYELPTMSRRERKNAKKDEQIPIVVHIVLLFLNSCLVILTVLPFNYLLLALEQFENSPNLIFTYVGVAIMIYAIVTLIRCMTQINHQNKLDDESDKKAGYINTGIFKHTQSPVQYYQLVFFFGAVVSAIAFYFGVIQWFLVILGYLITRRILLNRAAALEEQRKIVLEGDTPYKRYSNKTAIFNPFYPKNSLLKNKEPAKPKPKVTPDTEGTQSSEKNNSEKKKRPEKKERPKKERPKKEKKSE